MRVDQCLIILPGQESNSSSSTWRGRMKPKNSCCWKQTPSSANWLEITWSVDTGTISKTIEPRVQEGERESTADQQAHYSTAQTRKGLDAATWEPNTVMTSSPRNNLVYRREQWKQATAALWHVVYVITMMPHTSSTPLRHAWVPYCVSIISYSVYDGSMG